MSDPDWWGTYRCQDCDAKTRADTLPNYCPVCGTWGSVERDTLDY